MFKLKLNNSHIKPDYKCHLSGITMNKPCLISDCHANLGGCHKTNCLYMFYPGKNEFDKFDIMFATNQTEKKIKELFNIGKTKAYETGVLFSILSRLRDNNRSMHCEKCGVMRTTVGCCLNVKECEHRQKIQDDILSNTKLRYTEFKAKKSDVFLLLQHKDKITEFMFHSGSEKQWYDVLGLNNEKAIKYNLVRSLV